MNSIYKEMNDNTLFSLLNRYRVGPYRKEHYAIKAELKSRGYFSR